MIGIDEAGRGAWAGPMVAAAVRLDFGLEGLNDSKLLTPRKRNQLVKTIKQHALGVGIGWVSAQEIDQNGISWANREAMWRALQQLDYAGQHIILDGPNNFLKDITGTEAVIKADQKIPAVAAASIIAKVHRDAFMASLDAKHQGYLFSVHKGYGTKAHMNALEKLSVCIEHRLSYKPIKVYAGLNSI